MLAWDTHHKSSADGPPRSCSVDGSHGRVSLQGDLTVQAKGTIVSLILLTRLPQSFWRRGRKRPKMSALHEYGTQAVRNGRRSCAFCRTRKLRCDQPWPCTNCRSRGYSSSCSLIPESDVANARGSRARVSRASSGRVAASRRGRPRRDCDLQQSPFSASSTSNPSSSSWPLEPIGSPSLLVEVQNLRCLLQDLEQRVSAQSIPHCTGPSSSHAQQEISPNASTSSAASTPSLDLEHIDDVVTHLQLVSMGHGSHDSSIYNDELSFTVESIRRIPETSTLSTSRNNSKDTFIWLPRREEAAILVDSFITHLSYIQHVVHRTLLPAAVDRVYGQIDAREPVSLGNVVLLLSIIALTTLVWFEPTHRSMTELDAECFLFPSPAEAHAQTRFWIKQTYAVLNAAQDVDGALTLETIQGVITLSLAICNLEGVSIRYRSLIVTGLLLGRELGLHRTDDESRASASDANPLQAEMGRRAWWYLVATDWYVIAARVLCSAMEF